MKYFKLLLWTVCLAVISHAQAGVWEDLKPYVVTDETPIVFSPDNSTLVLEDPTGSISVEEALKRKDEFKTPKEIGALDARKHYWIMQKIRSGLKADRNHIIEQGRLWRSIHTHVLDSNGKLVTLTPSGAIAGYSVLSDIDPALPHSAEVPSRIPRTR